MKVPGQDGQNPGPGPLLDAAGRPLPPRDQPGYYPGFSTLKQQKQWDAATRQKINERVGSVPPLGFFTAAEAALMDGVIAHLLPQHDRVAARRIPILPRIDSRLLQGQTAGYRFEGMPPDGEAYRLGCQAIEQMAQASFGHAFGELGWAGQEQLLKSLHDNRPMAGAADIWRGMELTRYWALLMQDCLEAYYSHPWAWDEIGFGGPAYPRGYMRLEHGQPEPWEVDEEPYLWRAPAGTLSDPPGPDIAAHSDQPAQGQGGTH